MRTETTHDVMTIRVSREEFIQLNRPGSMLNSVPDRVKTSWQWGIAPDNLFLQLDPGIGQELLHIGRPKIDTEQELLGEIYRELVRAHHLDLRGIVMQNLQNSKESEVKP